MASPLPYVRVGLIVPKHAQTAVRRNKLKRRLRDIVRRFVLPSAPPVDIIIRARREAYDAAFGELLAEVVRLRDRLRTALGGI